MKKADIKVGGHYTAKVSGKLVTVRVDATRETNSGYRGHSTTSYDVTNLKTGRKTTFRSAMKFRGPAKEAAKQPSHPIPASSGAIQTASRSTARTTPTTTPTGTTGGATTNAVVEIEEEMVDGKPMNDRRQSLADKFRAKRDTGLDTAPHLIVTARAGTGKTTTLVEGLKRVKGIESNLTPSPQQAAVWESMALSSGRAQTILFVAFNKSIAEELKNRVPQGCEASTMHSMGLKAVSRRFSEIRIKVEGYHVSDLISELTGKDIKELRRFKMEMLQATEKLVSLCKMNLCDGSADELAQLASHYGVELNGSASEVFGLVPRVLERCKDVARDYTIDYDDMVWLPVVLDLPVQKYDLLLVDEAQDLNKCQQQLALKAGRRLILCGDPKQAIYGFAGADAESMPRMATLLGETERGCVNLPLTVTRRCGKAVVEEAKRIVPDFEAFETNGDGRILQSFIPTKTSIPCTETVAGDYRGLVRENDMILCRTNAPLVQQCFRFIKAGRKANIQGRDIGQGLISTVKKMKAFDVPELVGRLNEWLHQETAKENAKRNPSEQRLITLQDRYDCLLCFTENISTVEAVIQKIEAVFTDDRNGGFIRLSSVHKAKGLEAKRVFILLPKGGGMPHPMAKSEWQRDQEMNLKYVAITRAIEELVWVTESAS